MPKKLAPQPAKAVRPRKQRIDSAAAAVRVAMSANKQIEPPAHIRMTNEDMPFFNSVIKEFARSEWSDHQLEIAAMLARTMCDLERDQADLREAGTILYTDKDHPFINPLKGAVTQGGNQILAMRRSLSLHARAQAGDSRDVSKRQAKSKAMEDAFSDPDSLLARPMMQ